MATEFVTAARLEELPDFGGLEVTVKGRRMTLFKTTDGIFATESSCPHRGGPLAAGWIERGKVFCPLHGWEFDLRTGYCPTSEKILECHKVRVQGEEVQVEA